MSFMVGSTHLLFLFALFPHISGTREALNGGRTETTADMISHSYLALLGPSSAQGG